VLDINLRRYFLQLVTSYVVPPGPIAVVTDVRLATWLRR